MNAKSNIADPTRRIQIYQKGAPLVASTVADTGYDSPEGLARYVKCRKGERSAFMQRRTALILQRRDSSFSATVVPDEEAVIIDKTVTETAIVPSLPSARPSALSDCSAASSVDPAPASSGDRVEIEFAGASRHNVKIRFGER